MWNPIKILKRPPRTGRRPSVRPVSVRRPLRAEQLESRRLMAADAIHVGIVYIETDFLESESGTTSDEIADRFILSFTGGAPGTELTELRLSLDKDQDGLSVGDLIFDTAPGGRGKGGWHPFKVTQIDSVSGANVVVEATVEDGSTELSVRLKNFKAGDLLEFSIDVDEVLRNHADLDRFNAALDVIASGQEMQDALFFADFVAPHFEPTTAHALFVADYGDPGAELGLRLPPNEGPPPDSFPSRTAAAVAHTTQTPKPVSIAGTVWDDANLNLQRDPGEELLAGVSIALYRRDPATDRWTDTGHRQTTSATGSYRFGPELGLMPGEYQVVQTQPAGYFSVGAVVGSVDGQQVGYAASADILTGINIPLGGLYAVDYDFAEARPARVGGFVYRDDNDNGHRDPGEPGIGGVTMRLVPIDTLVPVDPREVVTKADGSYQFVGLPPGEYDIVQVTQPPGLDDGEDSPGTVDGQPVGVADNPGDAIRGVVLSGASVGKDYNFGELPRGIITGGVYLAAPGEDCGGRDDDDAMPLAGVAIELVGPGGVTIARTTTGIDGQYRFDDVSKGVYSLIEITPEGLIDGRAHVGRINGITVGTAVDGGLITNIVLPAGASATRYDFCEAAPAQISGYVYHDQNDDGHRDPGEPPIAAVDIELVDQAGQVVATTQTDSDGHYAFTGLFPGHYSIRQIQPAGYLDGTDTAGTIDGVPVGTAVNPGDLIRDIVIRQGQSGIDYNFGELLPASLAGRVHVDDNDNCLYDPGERLLAGVTIRLLDVDGTEVAVTTTDQHGRYLFSSIVPGTYTVVEDQPEGYFPGTARPGSAGGVKESANRIGAITLGSGEVAVDYDFCEKPPAEISGFVYVDQNMNHRRDLGEPPIAGTRIDLLDASGRQVATTTTDARGFYRFSHLAAGQYTLRQTQPSGYLQGSQQAGSAGGIDDEDNLISQIPIVFGATLTEYNFGEWLAASIAGNVYLDLNTDRIRDPGEPPLSGVTIELLDDAGATVLTTTSDAEGRYRFDGLVPGTYSVRQVQPQGFFHGGQVAGSQGGDASLDDVISAISLLSGTVATDYDFPEIPPASLAGFVFIDGEPLELAESPDPASLRQYRDGIRRHDSLPIAGVVLQLRDSQGLPVPADQALPGLYQGIIETVTDADGAYQFSGLLPGTYHLYQIQPDGFIDGLDTAGSHGGFAVNAADQPHDPAILALLESLRSAAESDPRYDAILQIELSPGAEAVDYHFSELLIEPPVTPEIPEPEIPEPEIPPPIAAPPPPQPEQPAATPTPESLLEFSKIAAFSGFTPQWRPVVVDAEYEVTWHLSIVNGGFPRGIGGDKTNIKLASQGEAATGFDPQSKRSGRWLLVDRQGNRVEVGDAFDLGEPGAIPLIGDFNGDGIDQIAIYSNGQWFVDFNGNGVWDEGDLWLRMGTALDRPVVGDWDGDGKADIGIFGRQWQFDPEAIVRDPGLPSPANTRRRNFIHTVSDRKIDLDQSRELRKGSRGELRSDAIDHVFRYGEHPDTPLAGDWNGDGIDTVGIYRGGHWTLDFDGDGRLDGDDLQLDFGQPGDIPVVGDWNGDGITNIGVVRGDLWIIDSDGDGRLTGNDLQVRVPPPSDDAVPIVGDWDGDGTDEFGWYGQAG